MQTFKKEERLSRKKLIDKLFSEGKSFAIPPFRVVVLENKNPESVYPVQVLIAVSKKNFKKAVDRNRMKRLIREAYRKNKENLYQSLWGRKKTIALALIYTAYKTTTYSEIEQKIIMIFERLQSEYEKTIG